MHTSKIAMGILCLFLSTSLSAQIPEEMNVGPNLIKNAGFEKLRRGLPKNDVDGSAAFRNSLDAWMSPTNTTPDLIMQVNSDGHEQPRTGKGMVGILTHNPQSKRSDTYREYIQARLAKPLMEGQEYYFECWIKRGNRSAMASNNIGMTMSPAPIMNRDFEPLLELKPIINEDKIINEKSNDWVKLAGTFTASNRERFLIIGNFFSNEDTKFVDAPMQEDAFQESYYLLDDVVLKALNPIPEIVEEEVVPEVKIIAATKIEKGATIRLDKIFFETAKWTLLDESFIQLNELLELMQEHPSMVISINGHTDSRGSDSYNMDLSMNRAKAVYTFLLENEIAISRIRFEGHGENSPTDSNDTDEGRQNNRRVEFVILDM